MCRLAAFPPGFPQEEALAIVKDFELRNDDGFGYGFLKGNRYEQMRWPFSFTEAVKKDGSRIFSHMPHKGWTIAHVRAATHGENTINNTHPFIKGQYMTVHNGVWSGSDEARTWLGLFVKFSGETDSEVAAFLINKIGPAQFHKYMTSGGVFLSLQRDGSLHLVKTYGDADVLETKYGHVIASQFPVKLDPATLASQTYHVWGAGGQLIESFEKLNPDGSQMAHRQKDLAITKYYGRHSCRRSDERKSSSDSNTSKEAYIYTPEDIMSVDSKEFHEFYKDYITKQVDKSEMNFSIWDIKEYNKY